MQLGWGHKAENGGQELGERLSCAMGNQQREKNRQQNFRVNAFQIQNQSCCIILGERKTNSF